jgi:organic radical activating enzyme
MNSINTTYRVNEIFYSLQGEGYFTGTAAVFLRLSGCNRKCSFCDTAHENFTEMTIAQIVAKVSEYPARHLVITGGETLLQLEDKLLEALHEVGFFIQIETNGTLAVPEAVDWVTCSPKAEPLNINRIDELKIVYQSQDVEAIAAKLPGAQHYFLQPCSGENIAETVKYICDNPYWRLSLQTHKLINIQ